MGAGLLVAGVVLAVAASGLSLRESWSARRIASRYLATLVSGDLAEHQRLSAAPHHADVKRALCRARYVRIRHVYDVVIPELARPRWFEVRQQVERLARGEEERLRTLIYERGLMGIGELASDSLQAVTDDSGLRQRFIYACGASRLDPADQALVGDAETFRTGPDEMFVLRAAWSVMPADLRGELGSPKAIAIADYPEKLAYYDAIARPLLAPRATTRTTGSGRRGSDARFDPRDCDIAYVPPGAATPASTDTSFSPDYQAIIAGSSRDDVATFDAFVERHGDATAHSVLVATLAGPSRFRSFGYDEEEGGSLFRGPRGRNQSQLVVQGSSQDVVCRLARRDLEWTVDGFSLNFERLAE